MWVNLKAAWSALYDWCSHHTTLVWTALAALLGMAVEKKLSEPKVSAKAQDDVDEQASLAHAKMAAVVFEKGAAAAHVIIHDEYQAHLQALSAEEQKQAVALLHDPAELARFLVLTAKL